jgi:hypothetical protein
MELGDLAHFPKIRQKEGGGKILGRSSGYILDMFYEFYPEKKETKR